MKKHYYQTLLEWTGSRNNGTQDYTSYSRDHSVTIEGKQHSILGSSDSSFRGDPSRYNPEELFLASIANCHMLWYLHLCATNHIIVLEYLDHATGVMEEDKNGGGRFTEVTLHPYVKVKDSSMIEKANTLHERANRLCFIANSCNFTIKHQPKTEVLN
ncbi:OsmC family protein [Ulvibacterium sp.]|uniref:OsmC family protein n=1 Tax=Ulvibacterium sp. TaxID=2665914 RepID=UPI002636F0B1|nr:OsmC family protein [Ulvibacterium sp.]